MTVGIGLFEVVGTMRFVSAQIVRVSLPPQFIRFANEGQSKPL
jgi:hypothetical protein